MARAFPSSTRHLLARAPRTTILRPSQRFASDYGSPTHKDGPGSDPLNAGPSGSADKEHPGAPPPAAGEGTGGATKADSKGHVAPTEKQKDFKPTQQQSRGYHSVARRAFGTSASLARPDEKKPQPKIHNPEKPKEDGEAKEHNEEFAKRSDRAHNKQAEDEHSPSKQNPGGTDAPGSKDRGGDKV